MPPVLMLGLLQGNCQLQGERLHLQKINEVNNKSQCVVAIEKNKP